MALFGKKKTVSPEELAAKEENRQKLENFEVTKAYGIKKYAPAMQFIFDKEARQFVVVEGPEETFRERNPWVVSFDDVTNVYLTVEENWIEEKNEYAPNGRGTLTMDRYDDVWWKYDFFITIETTHPYAGDITFQTNYKPNIVKVPSKGLFVRRGLEMHGRFEGEEIATLIEKMEKLIEEEPEAYNKKKVAQIITQTDPKGVGAKLKQDVKQDVYMKTLENMLAHIKRADRIDKLLK